MNVCVSLGRVGDSEHFTAISTLKGPAGIEILANSVSPYTTFLKSVLEEDCLFEGFQAAFCLGRAIGLASRHRQNMNGRVEMDRIETIRQNITKEMTGIEIAPWCKPVVPRSQGYDSYSIDIFDADQLRANAISAGIGYLAGAIEAVDVIGNAANIYDIFSDLYKEKKFDYIISSHNFEHLPDPVKFLQGCGKLLIDGGCLSMALPDKRFCFDHFRPVSTTADVISAFMEKRERPTFAQIFEQKSMESHLVRDGKYRGGFSVEDDPAMIHPSERLFAAFADWQKSVEIENATYEDAHCWTFTPASFELIMNDLYQLGLSSFTVEYVTEARENEFFLQMRHHANPEKLPGFFEHRKNLLVSVLKECAVSV